MTVNKKRLAWSYSTLKMFELCPRKYGEIKIYKNYVEPDWEHRTYGEELHEAFAKYLENDTRLPEQYSFAHPVLEQIKAIPGQRYAELQLGATTHLEPCGFFDRTVWCRGAVDFLVVDKTTRVAYLIDWKTGKDQYADKEQLVLMSLLTFLKFEVDIVKSALIFIVKGSLVPHTMTREETTHHWQQYRERVARMQKAYNEDVFNPTQNFTCRKHCVVASCEHRGS